jgi:septal ring-binding cell division protein DamX
MLVLGGRSLKEQASDSALARIVRLVSRGDRSGAHAAADSLLANTSSASGGYADALYWRAFTASNAAEAERDYLRVAIEYPLSPRAEEALLLLSQLEFARGDRSAAMRHLERLVRDHPTGRNIGRATFWMARIAFDAGDMQKACAALASARRQLASEDIETRNQVEYFLPRCTSRLTSRADSGTTASKATVMQGTPEYSLQVAAFKTNREAQALANRLKRRGFDVRVSHQDAWYRVRIGRYATRTDASRAQTRVKTSGVTTRVVVAEQR